MPKMKNPMPMSTKAKMQEIEDLARRQDVVHSALAELTFRELSDAIEAHVAARPDADATELERLSNALGRRAHMLAREAS